MLLKILDILDLKLEFDLDFRSLIWFICTISDECKTNSNTLFLGIGPSSSSMSCSNVRVSLLSWVLSKGSIGLIEISRTARNSPTLFKCSFSSRKKFQMKRLKKRETISWFYGGNWKSLTWPEIWLIIIAKFYVFKGDYNPKGTMKQQFQPAGWAW